MKYKNQVKGLFLTALCWTMISPTTLANEMADTRLIAEVEARVATRQSAFSKLEKGLDIIDDAIDDVDTDWEILNANSDLVLSQLRIIKGAFPLNRVEPETDDTRAKSAIWQKPEKFQTLMQKLENGINDLQKAGANQNSHLAKQGLQQAEGTCRSCHRSYRSLW